MDGGCNTTRSNGTSRNPASHDTTHLTPYQTAPFDLHVGSWGRREIMATNDDMAFSTECGSVNGFYTERLDTIEQYLSVLEGSTPQQISDAVYNSIKDRFDTYHHNRHRPDEDQLYGRAIQDPILVRDILQVRTLSMLAAGFGGEITCGCLSVSAIRLSALQWWPSRLVVGPCLPYTPPGRG